MCFSIKIDRDLNRLAKSFGAEVSRKYFEEYLSAQKLDPKNFKSPDEYNRVYPNYYAPVVLKEEGKKIIRPMRYQLLPHFCNENKYTMLNPKTNRKKQISTYNARLDSLEERKAWKNIFMKNHCLLPFTNFYEWVEDKGKKRQISFQPEDRPIMWAPALYDTWISEDKKETINSFAIITTDPAPEVQAMGHDRCPIFLKEEYLNDWLTPQDQDINEVFEMLTYQEEITYSHAWV